VTALPGKVGDELPDAVKHGLLIAGESPVIGAVELDESRLRDMVGEMFAGADADGAVAATVEHQCRNGDPRQKMAHVGIAQRFQHALECAGARGGAKVSMPAGPPQAETICCSQAAY
jgi:hypothetical protein